MSARFGPAAPGRCSSLDSRSQPGAGPIRPLTVAAGLLIVAAAWWLLGNDSAAEVRAAHADLARVLSKSGEGDDGLSVLQLRSLESMFAEELVVAGDANGLSASYSPEEIVGLIVRVRSVFASVELELGELTVELPAPDRAVATFRAGLSGRESDGELVREARSVVSRMRHVDGDWRFTEFVLSEAEPVPAPR